MTDLKQGASVYIRKEGGVKNEVPAVRNLDFLDIIGYYLHRKITEKVRLTKEKECSLNQQKCSFKKKADIVIFFY